MNYDNINTLLLKMNNTKNEEESTILGIELANEILKIFGASQNDLKYGEDVLNEAFPSSKFKHQKMESWFAKHPYFKQARIALTHFQSTVIPVETKFYRLSESANKAKISATTQIGSNWEDSNLTMKPQYKVGIDFFLNEVGTSLLIVLTNKGNLRVLELSEKLSKTQIEIFDHVKGCFLFNGINPNTGLVDEFEPQRTIHKNLWNSFALQEVNKKFYLGIAEHFELLVQHLHRNIPENVSTLTAVNDAKLFATRLLGRLLFLWFLNKKDVISKKHKYFDVDSENSAEYYENKLKKLFFNVLNTPIEDRLFKDFDTPYLNGGLFDPHPNDWADKLVSFPINWFTSLYEHFNSFNFTTDESSPDYEQIAIDPEMLGRVFENLLATIVPETAKAASEKKNKGAFYTPREIVDYMSKESLKGYLKQYQNNQKDNDGIEKLIDMNDAEFLVLKSTGTLELWGSRTNEVRANLIEALNKIKVLDPACGSGAFPMGLLQLIVRTYDRLSAYYDKYLRIHRPIKPNEKNDIYETKLTIIQNNLFGSDIEPMAIEISRLRSWLSLVIDDKGKIEPLPNLDFNFVCSNSLIPLDKPVQINVFENLEYELEIDKLRNEYFQIHDKKSKLSLKTMFTTLYDKNLEFGAETKRVRQLRSWNPFEADKPAVFFDSKIMFNVDSFDIVIANPPYVRNERISTKDKQILQSIYRTPFDQWSLYVVFFEHAINQLNENGFLCFITPNQWLSAKYGKNLRNLLSEKIVSLTDFRSFADFDNASVNTFITIADFKSKSTPVSINVFDDLGSKSSILVNRDVFCNMKENLGVTLSKDIHVVNRIKSSFTTKFKDRYKAGHSFSIPDFYLLTNIIEENPNPSKNELKLVNTGTLCLNGSKWGIKMFKYDKKDYQFPVVNRSAFLKMYPTREIQAGPKLIIASMGGLNIDIDIKGEYLGTRPTIWLSANNIDDLKISYAILNSDFIRWFYQQQYSVAGMTGLKVRYSHIDDTPLPEITYSQRKMLVQIVDRILISGFNRISINDRMEINKVTYQIYNLNAEEIDLIECFNNDN